MQKKLVYILLPDGVGLRNFSFGDFLNQGREQGFEAVFWNNTEFPLSDIGLDEIRIKNARSHFFSDIFKRAKTIIELKQNSERSKSKVYLSYIFPNSYKGIKRSIKSVLVDTFVFFCSSKSGLRWISKQMLSYERKTQYYKSCINQLQNEMPAILFSTNQRPLASVAPLLAAQDLGIPTATFIFSWDNLPKGTLVVNSDYYFVWSDHMKKELLYYYPHIKEDQIYITGTPQFEPHYKEDNIIPKKEFYQTYGLDDKVKYICFSGDDITTSPNDHFYLEDLAKNVRKLNEHGENYGVIYRKCPVDFSDRHMSIYNDNKDIIKLIDPKWENLGNSWNRVMPTPEDIQLLVSTIRYSEVVINVGSSMVFDFAAHNKPCIYLNYDTEKVADQNWKIKSIYKFIHFQSMPNSKAVSWLNDKNDFEKVLKASINSDLKHTKEWYFKICGNTPDNSIVNFWNSFKSIIQCT